MHDPEVLILDEPTSGLDPLMQNRFIELIIEERERGKTILMSSHIFEEVERTCHRVAIIREGKLVAVDNIDTLKASQIKRYVVTFENGSTETITINNDFQPLIDVLSKNKIQNLTAPTLNLEEIFMQYYGKEVENV